MLTAIAGVSVQRCMYHVVPQDQVMVELSAMSGLGQADGNCHTWLRLATGNLLVPELTKMDATSAIV